MASLSDTYASVLNTLIKKGMSTDSAVQSVRDVLTSRGQLGLFPKIAHAYSRLAERARRRSQVTLCVARESDSDVARVALKRIPAFASTQESDISVAVDNTLIGGWRVEGAEYFSDSSYKHQLQALYNKVLHE